MQAVERKLLTPGEVARILRVDPKTVTRWAIKGQISSTRTPGGHRRFFAAEIMSIAEGKTLGAQAGAVNSRNPR